MKKNGTWEKRRKALKKAAFIGIVSLSAAVVLCLIASCGNDPLKPVSDSTATEPAGLLIQEKCSTCHSLDKVRNYEDNDWNVVVDDMIVYGIKLTAEEAADVIAHLEEGKSF